MEENKEITIEENVQVRQDEALQEEEATIEKMSFTLDNFTGPLDLLYHLVKKNKMEIEDIEIEAFAIRHTSFQGCQAKP